MNSWQEMRGNHPKRVKVKRSKARNKSNDIHRNRNRKYQPIVKNGDSKLKIMFFRCIVCILQSIIFLGLFFSCGIPCSLICGTIEPLIPLNFITSSLLILFMFAIIVIVDKYIINPLLWGIENYFGVRGVSKPANPNKNLL